MLSSVLRSLLAIAVNILIMRAFIRLREYLATHEELRRKTEELEQRLGENDQQIAAVFEAIPQIMDDEEQQGNRPRIGFQTERQGRGE